MAEAWDFSVSQSARTSTDDAESYLKKKGLSFPTSYDSLLPTSCRPELDVTPELSAEDAFHIQSLVGILR